MDVTLAPRMTAVALSIVAASLLSFAQPSHSSYDPAGRNAPTTASDGFVDFTLKRINHADQDYGKCLAEGRALVLEDTIKKGYFWSNLIALGMLGCLFLIILYQHRVQARREWVMAEMLGQYEERVSRSQVQLQEATIGNRGLMDALNAYKEAARRTGTSQTGASDAAVFSKPQRVINTTPKHSTSNDAERSAAAAIATEPAGQIELFHGNGDLVVTINSLRQQLAQSEEEKKLLRRRIANADRQLAAEQHKNRQLKGG